ncbi:hypothetical protein [Planctomycetes bacterium Pan216]|uniref:hypothetical protein n=1 Tax=Kolteria novifilia TaxID=2527975 RepID=UPI0011A33917
MGLGVGAGVISYWGIREAPPTAPPAEREPSTPAARTVSITMPHEEPVPPLGPNRSTFQTSCTICHSTRLVLNQPPFAEERWRKIVEKMINVYGAPVGATRKEEIVGYLTAISARKQLAGMPEGGEQAAIGRPR